MQPVLLNRSRALVKTNYRSLSQPNLEANAVSLVCCSRGKRGHIYSLQMDTQRRPVTGQITRRVRTGCLTCKIRKVKCGEEKPACKKCTSTGRTCDGYGTPPGGRKRGSKHVDPTTGHSDSGPTSGSDTSNSSSPEHRHGVVQIPRNKYPSTITQPVVHPPSVAGNDSLSSPFSSNDSIYDHIPRPPTLRVPSDDLRSMQYFLFQTGPTIRGFFDSEFCTSTVWSLAQTEDIVRYALVAISSIHELSMKARLVGRELFDAYPPERSRLSSNALNAHSKALKLAQERIGKGASSIDVLLIAVVLFTCFESLRGYSEAALTHLQGGLGMIAIYRAERGSRMQGMLQYGTESTYVEEDLVPMFSRLTLLSASVGQQQFHLLPQDVLQRQKAYMDPANEYTTVNNAKAELLPLLDSVLRFIQRSGRSRYPPFCKDDLLAEEFKNLKTCLRKWKNVLDSLDPNLPDSARGDVKFGPKVLQIHCVLASMWLETSLSHAETAFDHQLTKFEYIVIATEDCIQKAQARKLICQQNGRICNDASGHGLIGPVYSTILKCRKPNLRRRALALLSKLPLREGLWNAEESMIVGRKLIHFEERWMLGRSSKQGPGDAYATEPPRFPEQVPPNTYRVHECSIRQMAQTGRSAYIDMIVSMQFMPDGLDGPWDSYNDSFQTQKRPQLLTG